MTAQTQTETSSTLGANLNNAAGDFKHLIEDGRRVAKDVRVLVDNLQRDNPLSHYYAQNPYMVIAAAAGIGYVLGGGLFSPFTRRMLRIGMKAMLIPAATRQFQNITQGEETGEGASLFP